MTLGRVTLGLWLGLALACGGTGAPDAGPALAAPVVAASTEVIGPKLFVLDPSQGCAWRVLGVDGGTREIARTAVCPDRLWFSPDGQQAVASGGGWAWYGPLDALIAVRTPAETETVFPVHAKPMVAHLAYSAEDIRLVTARLDGDAFGPPTAAVLSEVAVMMGDPLGSHADADAGWTRLHFRDAPSKFASLDAPTEAAKAAVNATSQDASVGQLQVAASFLTYRVEFGDTPHPVLPVVWCAATDCASSTPLSGATSEPFAAEPAGELVLISEEYTSARPAVYRAGVAAPVWVGPAGAIGMWAPAGM